MSPGPASVAEKGKLMFGTVDTWLIWRLTRGEVHVTDVSNASRTMLFNINTLDWDQELLDLFGIPRSMMPEVRSSSEVYGHTKTTIFAHKVPISGTAGDQQAALFGQMCTEPGMVKNTYGTGCFLLMNSGEKPILSQNNLITTVAWKIGDKVNYALEGSIFVGGSVIQWLRDGLRASSTPRRRSRRSPRRCPTRTASTSSRRSRASAPRGGTSMPAARSRVSAAVRPRPTSPVRRSRASPTRRWISRPPCRATPASRSRELKVDGGASRNNLLMQFQADILGTKVIRPQVVETTAMGAAYLAGLAVGYWSSIDEIRKQWQVDRVFEPSWDEKQIQTAKAGWEDAVKRTLSEYTK